MSESTLLDSNILIDYLRGRSEAVEFVEGLKTVPRISAVTVAELYAGVRDGREREVLDRLVTSFEIVDVDEVIAVMGGLLKRQFARSHGIGIADAIIAATARVAGSKLATLNTKHFPMFPDIEAPYERA